MATTYVYIINVPLDDAPYIDFKVDSNDQGISTSRLNAFLLRETDIPNYRPVSLIPSNPVGQLDYLGYGPHGILSDRAWKVLDPYMSQCFDVIPVLIGGRPYYCIRAVGPINVLDREHCKLIMADDGSNEIAVIKRFAFFKDKISDPLIFTTPEVRIQYMFGTDSISKLANDSKLCGFRFVNAELEDAIYM